MSKPLWLCCALLIIAPCLIAGAAPPDLTWKMAFLKTGKGKMESLPFGRPLTLADGDQFQIVVAPSQACFVDVLYEDTTGQIDVLFRGAVKAGQVVTLPADNQSFQVSPPKGTEKIHVVVSTEAQTALESRLKALPKGSASVVDELAKIRASLSSLAEVPEKPVAMGGVSRGLPADIKITEFKGQATYVKTVRFDH